MKSPFYFLFTLFFLFGCASTAVEPTPLPPTSRPEIVEEPTPEPPTETPTAVPTETGVPTEIPTNTPTIEPTDTPAPTATAVPDAARFPVAGQFTIYGEEAAVPNDNIGPSGKQYTDPGGVVFHDGQYHMFHNAFTGWPAAVDVMYSVSDDGINWTLAQETPVFEGEDLPFVGVAALASSVIVRDDGTWMLYFYTWEDFTWPVSESSIGLATATSPFGPWTAVSRPVLRHGTSGEWDELAVRTPSVIQTDEGYIMYYSGHQRNSASIGRAFSEDGESWTRYDDPSTTEAPFAKSDPIFSGIGAGWDKAHVYQPRVVQTDDGWVMLYTSANQVGGNTLNQEHGLAFSPDGDEWVRSETVIFRANNVRSSGQNIWFTELAYALDTYTIFLELGASGETEIYVATFNSEVFP